MISYIISTAEFNKILKVLTSVFNLQFIFFDLAHNELKRLENKGMSGKIPLMTGPMPPLEGANRIGYYYPYGNGIGN